MAPYILLLQISFPEYWKFLLIYCSQFYIFLALWNCKVQSGNRMREGLSPLPLFIMKRPSLLLSNFGCCSSKGSHFQIIY